MVVLENDELYVRIDPIGGRLKTIYGKKTGIEYLWQGDRKYWGGQAPNLFPIVGRLYKSKYTVQKKEYEIGIHGFLNHQLMTIETENKDSCILLLRENEATLSMYPYHFEYRLYYTLQENKILIVNSVKNMSEETMYFGIGGHPGFNVPLVSELKFEDYHIIFPKPCTPERILFSENILTTGEKEPFSLKEDRFLPLRHDLFDQDAVVLLAESRSITISTPKDLHGVRVSYPDMPYVGLWHKPQTDAPFVCIEPWSMLPGREETVEELSVMSNITSLSSRKSDIKHWSIEVW